MIHSTPALYGPTSRSGTNRVASRRTAKPSGRGLAGTTRRSWQSRVSHPTDSPEGPGFKPRAFGRGRHYRGDPSGPGCFRVRFAPVLRTGSAAFRIPIASKGAPPLPSTSPSLRSPPVIGGSPQASVAALPASLGDPPPAAPGLSDSTPVSPTGRRYRGVASIPS